MAPVTEIVPIDGVSVGHWTDPVARTGCTVVVLPEGVTASGEIRGGAPATREFALLDPGSLVGHVDAVVLSGGSAFGLAAADGVMQWLAEHDRGFPTAGGRVPIVVGMCLYDLAVGDGTVRPGPVEGRAAAESASSTIDLGAVGAGTGATVGKWGGPDAVDPGGLVAATVRSGDVTVWALIAVNALGWIDDGGTIDEPGPRWRPPESDSDDSGFDEGPGTNTTIGVVVTDARLDPNGCHAIARSAHDGFARALHPSHTAADGDAVVVVATGAVEADIEHVRVLAQHAVTRAIRRVADLDHPEGDDG